MTTFKRLCFFLLFLFLYSPILVLVIFSFNSSKSRCVFSGFSLKWYVSLFGNKAILSSLLNTFFVAMVASLLATIIGTMAAIGIFRSKKYFKNIFMYLNNITLINPEIITGISLMVLFIFLFNIFKFLRMGLLTLVIAHTTICIPYVVLSVLPKLYNLDPCLKYAAKDLGCTPIKAFFKVTLFNILPGIISGFIMSFTVSLDDFIISYFTGGTTQVLSTLIYSMTKKVVNPEVNAISTILLLIVFLLILFINMLNRKEIKNQSKINK